MKLVLAFVQPFKIDAVTRELERIPTFPGMSIGNVRGFGREHALVAQPQEQLEDFTDKVQIEAVVNDDLVDLVINAIARAAHTGQYGDGMIFVLPVERSVRIATFVTDRLS